MALAPTIPRRGPDRYAPTILKRGVWIPEQLDAEIRAYRPRTGFGRIIQASLVYLPPEMAQDVLDRLKAIVVLESSLRLVHIHPDVRAEGGILYDDYGIVSRKVVTDNGVGLLVDTFDNTLANGDCRYHGLGTGGTAEAASQTALVTELTTEYNPNSTRATGTFSQPSANISQSVATNTVDASAAVTEHAPFTQAATGGGVMLDRSLFSVINLASGDSLQSTYQLTLTSGG
jgi:hypothetical protein